MKTLLENWRRFIAEDESEDKMALYHDRGADEETLVLYTIEQREGSVVPQVISFMELEETYEPCIPQSWQVSRTYTEEGHRNQGWGSKMYGIAFFVINRQGKGLTSDQNSSTSKEAGRQWNKLIDNGKLSPRATSGKPPYGGHDKFDYGGENTPDDPLDDCSVRPEGPVGDGTNRSWSMKDYNEYRELYREYTINHQEALQTVPVDRQERFLQNLLTQGDQGFLNNYGFGG